MNTIIALVVGFIVANLPFDFLYLIAGFLVVIISLTLILPIIGLIMHKESLLQPITMFLFVSSGYVFGAIYLLIEKQSGPFQYHLDDTNIIYFVQALFYVFVGIVSFQVAYFVARESSTELSLTSRLSDFGQSDCMATRWRFAIIILTVIGMLGYYLFVSSSGGLIVLLKNIISRNRLRTTDYYRLLFQFAQVAVLLWFASDKMATKKISFWALVVLNIVLLMSLGNRGVVLLFIIQLMVLGELKSINGITSVIKHRFRNLLKILVFIIMFLFVGVGLLAWRQASISSIQGSGFSINEIVDNAIQLIQGETFIRFLFGGANLASIEAVATIVEATPNRMGYLWGKSFFWLVLMPIPRIVWPNKPTTLGIVIKRSLFDTYATGGGVPPSWIGELYLNFHIFGVILGSLLFGYLSAKVYDYYLAKRNSPFIQVFYVYYLVVFTFALTKTEFRITVIRLLGFFMAILIAYLIVNYNSKHRKCSDHSTYYG